MIKPASNNQIKLLRKLSQRKHREKEQLFFVEGVRAVEQVLENDLLTVESIFIDERRLDEEQTRTFSGLFHSALLSMESDVFDEVTDTDNPQGILALCKMPDEASVNDLKENEGVIVATDAIQDPGNLGTIIRTSAWFGSKALLSGKGSVDVYNPKVVRSTAGATGALPVISGDLNEILSELESSGWKTLLLDGNPGAIALNALPVHNKTILVVGNEANGIDKSLITPDRTRVLIPGPSSGNPVESLNAAVAMSITLWSVNN